MVVKSLIGANHRLDILSGAICELLLLLVNIVYLLVKVSNTQYILSQWFTVLHSVVIVIVVVVKTLIFSVFRPCEQRRPINGKMKCFHYRTKTITVTTECNTVNHYDKIFCVFESLTNK